MKPEIHLLQNPAQLAWKPVVKVEHFYLDAKTIFTTEEHRGTQRREEEKP
jgi:hypothetical protein